MSRPGVAATCAAVLLTGFILGRTTGRHSTTVTVTETTERTVVVSAQHLGAARDARDAGPLDLALVRSARRENMLVTTIVARRPWRDALLRRGRVGLSIVYDIDDNGTPDRRDVIFLLRGRLVSWISDFAQGVQGADVTRRSATTVSVARDATIFYSGSGEGRLLTTSPIGVAVVASWRGGRDRVPDRGWITVPPPTR